MIFSDKLYVLTSKIDDEYILLNKQCIISCIKDKPFYANLKNAEKSKIRACNMLDYMIKKCSRNLKAKKKIIHNSNLKRSKIN